LGGGSRAEVKGGISSTNSSQPIKFGDTQIYIDNDSVKAVKGGKTTWKNTDANFSTENFVIVKNYLFIIGSNNGAYITTRGFIINLNNGRTIENFGYKFLFLYNDDVYLYDNRDLQDEIEFNKDNNSFRDIRLKIFNLKTQKITTKIISFANNTPFKCQKSYNYVNYLTFDKFINKKLLFIFKDKICSISVTYNLNSSESIVVDLSK